jgi:UDP-glucose 4,6-dehydratase
MSMDIVAKEKEITSDYMPQNILVTGGCGLIGSHVVTLLVNKYPQYKIVNYDRLDYCSSTKNLEPIANKPNYKFVKGNILSADLLTYIIKKEEIDTIINFAAQTHVDNSFGNSIQFTETNVLGTHVLLEAAKLARIKRFIHVSTDEVKGESENMCAEDVLEPTNPYAATKAAAELIVKSYHRSFNLPVIITRSNNVYGPFQFPEKIIPKFICQLTRNRKLTIHGNGSNKRNYIHVDDVAAAFDLILHHGVVGGLYNIASDECHSNIEVARLLLQKFGLADREEEMLEYVEDRLFNDKRYYIDPAATIALGWTPRVSWEDGINRTIDWYKRYGCEERWHASVESALVPHPRVGEQIPLKAPL